MRLPSFTPIFQSRPDRHWIAPSAVLIGRVRLQVEASVWFGAVLRGDNEWLDIGERSNIQDQVMIHSDMGYPVVVGSNVTIGHSAILHGRRPPGGTLVPIGAPFRSDA
eukprot:gene46071-62399_t